MRQSGNPKKSQEETLDFDPDVDRFPFVQPLLRRALAAPELPLGTVEWVELHAFADGSATVRIRRPRADETDGCFLPPAE